LKNTKLTYKDMQSKYIFSNRAVKASDGCSLFVVRCSEKWLMVDG